jgi:hypothetical protein
VFLVKQQTPLASVIVGRFVAIDISAAVKASLLKPS